MFPKFLLKKMYKKDTLTLTNTGFSFIIKNNIANGDVVEVFNLKVNDTDEIAFKDVIIGNDTLKMSSDQISIDNPFPLKKQIDTTFLVTYAKSKDFLGTEMKIGLKFKVQVRDSKMTIEFDFTDNLKSES